MNMIAVPEILREHKEMGEYNTDSHPTPSCHGKGFMDFC